MDILLTNDDGIHAPGLNALYDELSKVANVTVVAPLAERSGASRSLTIKSIIQLTEIYKNDKFFGYAVDGTPVDCVKLAFQQILEDKPDYVFSGINKGANISSHVQYSGTVSAASEGFLEGIPSVAVSLTSFEVAGFTASAVMARRWLELIDGANLPASLYNINVPPLELDELKGFAPAELSTKNFGMIYEKRVSPFGDTYFWLADVDAKGNFEPESDISVLKRGCATVTPLDIYGGADLKMLELLKKSGVFTDEN